MLFRMEQQMNTNFEFSIDPKGLEVLGKLQMEHPGNNRFHSSHTVWQLARMGAYNAAGKLPLAIRIESQNEMTELYPDGERYVAVLDSRETGTDSQTLTDILTRFAVRLAVSSKPEQLAGHVVSCAKSAESAPDALRKWPTAETMLEGLIRKLHEIQDQKIGLPDQQDIDSLAKSAIDRMTMEYLRRRHGRYGEESLWGRELSSLRVLQDAGIAGHDLEPALKSLIEASRLQNGRPVVFDRNSAYLLIRDFQRRAYLSIPGVRVVDRRMRLNSTDGFVPLPGTPDFSWVVHSNAPEVIQREIFPAALKWARRAIKISGRGLLPIFLYTGEPGSGRSFLLKQIGWELQKQGYAVAELSDIDRAAKEADKLAVAAMAGDSPLILLWDDPLALNIDPVAAVKEIAGAQISGAPILILTTGADTSVFPKYFSRTIIEEFVVHSLTDTEKQLFTAQDTAPDSEITGAELPLTQWLRSVHNMNLTEFAGEIIAAGSGDSDQSKRLFKVFALMGMLQLSTPDKLLEQMFDPSPIEILDSTKTAQGIPVFRKIGIDESGNSDLRSPGHYLLVREIWKQLAVEESEVQEMMRAVIQTCVREPLLQELLIRIAHAAFQADGTFLKIKAFTGEILAESLKSDSEKVSTLTLSTLFNYIRDQHFDALQQTLVDIMVDRVRSAGVDSFTALSPLLRNRLGALTDEEILKALNAAKPSIDRIGFKFLLKFLGEHLPGESGIQAIEDARTAAARDPDAGYAVAAYLKLVLTRGTEEQLERVINETRTWLQAAPDDRVVRSVFLDFILKKGDLDLKRSVLDDLEQWLDKHFDEGALRNGYIELVMSLNDPAVLDRALLKTADWVEKRGNNRAVRKIYFRLSEKRRDKTILSRACQAALAWLSSHPDDMETLRSLIFLTGRLKTGDVVQQALPRIAELIRMNTVNDDMVKHYLTLADRINDSRVLADALAVADNRLSAQPDDLALRETILGLAAQKIDNKLQVKLYNKNVQWLSGQTSPPTKLEYLTGRLGVRAGVARRAIPILERVVAGDDSELKGHAKLWLGTAYRSAGEYLDAKKVWTQVLESEDEKMKERAEKNIQSLDGFLSKKFPEGYPPKPEPGTRSPRRQYRDRSRPTGEVQERGQDSQRRRRQTDSRQKTGSQRRFRSEEFSDTRQRSTGSERFRQRRSFDRRSQRSQQQSLKADAPHQGSTLGDLLRLQGLDLKSALGQKTEKKKKKKK